MVLSTLPVPGRPTNLDYNRAKAYGATARPRSAIGRAPDW